MTINNYPLVIQAALAGQGVALGWRPLVDDLLASGQLRAAWPEPVTTERGYYLVHANRRDRSPEVRLFRRWLQGEVRASRSPLPGGREGHGARGPASPACASPLRCAG